jgi:hypothetical protein
MKKYYVRQKGKYVNYISLFSKTPIRLKDTTSNIAGNNRIKALQPHIIYTEDEMRIVIELVGMDAVIIPLEEFGNLHKTG